MNVSIIIPTSNSIGNISQSELLDIHQAPLQAHLTMEKELLSQEKIATFIDVLLRVLNS